MPEENAVSLNSAARDVIAERQRQVSAEGYSLHRDDLYVNGELAEAAATNQSGSGLRFAADGPTIQNVKLYRYK